jgi:hypothetical protein
MLAHTSAAHICASLRSLRLLDMRRLSVFQFDNLSASPHKRRCHTVTHSSAQHCNSLAHAQITFTV